MLHAAAREQFGETDASVRIKKDRKIRKKDKKKKEKIRVEFHIFYSKTMNNQYEIKKSNTTEFY